MGTKAEGPGLAIVNSDGTESSEITISVGVGEKTVLIATVVPDEDGILTKLSDQEAIDLFMQGKNPVLGTFDTVEEADEFAAKRSAAGGRFPERLK